MRQSTFSGLISCAVIVVGSHVVGVVGSVATVLVVVGRLRGTSEGLTLGFFKR
jgi:hypothetical protein